MWRFFGQFAIFLTVIIFNGRNITRNNIKNIKNFKFKRF